VPQDLFQIALEHHRAGRLTQAEAGYRAVLGNENGNPHASHWLGVLLLQAGDIPAAIALLESAAAKCPLDAAYLHNLAQAYLAAGKREQAIEALQRAVAADPQGRESLTALAQARLSRGKPSDANAAVDLLRRAQAVAPDAPDIAGHLGIALLAARRFGEAIDAFRAALGKDPDNASLHYHMALASRGAKQPKETRKALIKALELEPAMAQAWCALAMLDGEGDNWQSAAGLFRRAIAADRNYRSAYEGLANVLRREGKSTEAKAVLEQARHISAGPGKETPKAPAPTTVAELERHLKPTSQQAQVHFAMAALMNFFPPMQTPSEAVVGLFDRYATKFDSHLVGILEYTVPEKLVEALRPFWNQTPWDILDAGCGTGLCGPLLRPMARSLAGVDLSPAMIEKARERAVYDHLEVGDLIDCLRKSPAGFDLLVSADVLIYLGESVPFFDASFTALRPGGILAYSVESCEGDRYELVPRSRRFRHSKPYLQRLAAIHGFEQLYFESLVIRKEHDLDVNGYLAILRRPM
jgi:predicted TPR repeat methyltransferase